MSIVFNCFQLIVWNHLNISGIIWIYFELFRYIMIYLYIFILGFSGFIMCVFCSIWWRRAGCLLVIQNPAGNSVMFGKRAMQLLAALLVLLCASAVSTSEDTTCSVSESSWLVCTFSWHGVRSASGVCGEILEPHGLGAWFCRVLSFPRFQGCSRNVKDIQAISGIIYGATWCTQSEPWTTSNWPEPFFMPSFPAGIDFNQGFQFCTLRNRFYPL